MARPSRIMESGKGHKKAEGFDGKSLPMRECLFRDGEDPT